MRLFCASPDKVILRLFEFASMHSACQKHKRIQYHGILTNALDIEATQEAHRMAPIDLNRWSKGRSLSAPPLSTIRISKTCAPNSWSGVVSADGDAANRAVSSLNLCIENFRS